MKNLNNISVDRLEFEIQKGAKFVYFEYCFSIVLMTFKRSSSIYLIRSGESYFMHALPYIFISFVFGWWGFPWGPIYTISSIFNNLKGGKDVTDEVAKSFNFK